MTKFKFFVIIVNLRKISQSNLMHNLSIVAKKVNYFFTDISTFIKNCKIFVK